MRLLDFRYRSVLILVSGSFVTGLSPGCRRAATPAEEGANPAPVEAITARTLLLGEWTELLGSTQPLPNRAARISAPVEGRVVSMLKDANGKPITEGQEVRAGDVIVQLDARIVQANRDKVAAALEELGEQKEQAANAVKLAAVEVKRLEELSRATSLNGQMPLVSRIELEKAHIALDDARSKQRGAERKLDSGAKELQALNEQLKLYTLSAPIAGRLGLLQVVPGQTLAAGATVADVIDLDEIDVLCFVPPHAASRLALDQPARMAGDSSGPPGKVAFVAVQAQSETGNFAVKVRFPNRDLRLRGNIVLRIEVQTKPEKEVLTIPEAALMEDQEPPAVIVVQDIKREKNKEGKEEQLGKARKLRAVLGRRQREWQVVEILRLEDPEKKEHVPVEEALFVINGGHGLQDGDVVKLKEEDDEEK